MKKFFNQQVLWVTGIIILVFSMMAWADTLVLKDGRVLQGNFKGGTDSAIQFEADGKVQEIALSDITSLTFSPRAAQTAAAEQPAPPPAATGAAMTATGEAVTVPAATKLMVKLDQAVSTASHQAGSTITGVLDIDLVADGKVVAPKGSKLYGKVLESVGGRRIGNQKIVLQFTDLMINNQKTPIKTPALGAEGGRGGAVKAVGAGALIGAAAGDAGAGALVGAGVAVLAGGNHIQIPAGTLAEIPLEAPLTVQ